MILILLAEPLAVSAETAETAVFAESADLQYPAPSASLLTDVADDIGDIGDDVLF